MITKKQFTCLLSTLILLISSNLSNAQIKLQSYIDIGGNNASEGVFVKDLYRISYEYKTYSFETGMQFDLHSNNPNTLTGFDIIASKDFLMNDFPFEAKGFFMLNRFSDLLYETNFGGKIETKKLKHFLFAVGTNFKTYSVNSYARKEYSINKSDSKLNENFNLIYLITAYLKPYENDWNLGITCTNIDYYTINQSTNPVFNLQMKYKIKSNLSIYSEIWYKQAGIFNIQANYFGCFFRGGVKWEI